MESAGPCRTLSLAVAVGWVATSAQARSATPAEARLEVIAPPRCVTRADLADRVALRSSRIRFVGDERGTLSLRVQVAVDGRGTVSAALAVVQPDGRRSLRRLSAASCDDAADALAVMITVLLDPSAAIDARPAPPAGAARPPPPAGAARPPPPAGAGRPPPPPAAAPRPEPPPPTATAVVEAPPPPPPAPSSPEPLVGPAVRRFGAGASFRAISGPAPRPMLGAAIDAVLAFDRQSLWSPALRLTAARHLLSGWAAAGGKADFMLDVLALDLCPLWWHGPRLGVRACASGTVGRLGARGYETYFPEAHDRLFASVGAAVLAGLSLSRHVELGATLAAGVNPRRDAFAFSPTVFYKVPALSGVLGVGLDAKFP